MTERDKEELRRKIRNAELTEAELEEAAGGGCWLTGCQTSCEPGCSQSCSPGGSGGTELE